MRAAGIRPRISATRLKGVHPGAGPPESMHDGTDGADSKGPQTGLIRYLREP